MLKTGLRTRPAALQQHQPWRAALRPAVAARAAPAGAPAPAAPLPPPPRPPAALPKKAPTATPPTVRRPAAPGGKRPPIQRDFAGGTGAARPWPDTLRVDARSDVSGAAGSLAKALRALQLQEQQQQQPQRRAAAAAAAQPGGGGGGIAPAPAAARPQVVRLWARDRPAAWRALAAIALADRMLRQTDGRMIVFQPTVVTRGADEDEGGGGEGNGAGTGGEGEGKSGAAKQATPQRPSASSASASGPKPGEYAFFVATLPAGEIVADNILTASRGGGGGGGDGSAGGGGPAAPAPAAAAAEGEVAQQDQEQEQPAQQDASSKVRGAGGRGRGRPADGLSADAGAATEQARALSRAVMARVLGRGHTAVEARGARAAAVALDAAIGARRGLLVRARDAAVLIGSNSGLQQGQPGQQQQQQKEGGAEKGEGGGGAKLIRLVVVECAPRDVTAVRLRAAGDAGTEPSAAVRRA